MSARRCLAGGVALIAANVVACDRPVRGPQTWSVVVETNELKLNGTRYDYAPDVTVMGGPVAVNAPEPSKYPDLRLVLVTEDGVQVVSDADGPSEIAGETGAAAGSALSATSPCDDLLACQFEVDVPSGYFMLLALDADLKRHDYVSGVIFSDRVRGRIDPGHVDAVEARAREWMAGSVDGVPAMPFPVVRRRDCRTSPCESNGLTGTASFSVTSLGPAAPSLEAKAQPGQHTPAAMP